MNVEKKQEFISIKADSVIGHLASQIEDLEKRLDKAREYYTEQKNRIEQLETENAKQNDQLESARDHYLQQQDQIKSLEEQNVELQKQNEQLTSALTETEDETTSSGEGAEKPIETYPEPKQEQLL